MAQPAATAAAAASSSSLSDPAAALDPHALAADALGDDATHAPDSAAMEAEEQDAAEAHVHLLLPTVFLIRHGQSLFNAHHAAFIALPPKGQQLLGFGAASASAVKEGTLIGGLPLMRRQPYSDPRLIDAPLTPRGQEQAHAAHEKVKHLGIDLVLSTPLTRAIQTSILAFRPNANSIDWSQANVPSLNAPLRNVLVDAPPAPTAAELHPPIRIIPHHVENLCASCDVGIPLSVLESRFANEPNLDFESAKQMMSDCWWAGANVGANVSHLVIKRAHPQNQAAAAAAASASASAAASAASASPASPAQSSSASSITLKHTDQMADLSIKREQSDQIDVRTQKLLLYLLTLAEEHSRSEHKHRAMRITLTGHCGYFARLSGKNLDNCELAELDWGHVLTRNSLKGFLTLPAGFTQSDVGNVRRQGAIVRHWIDELSGRRNNNSRSGSRPGSAGSYSAARPPASSNTADLAPVAGKPQQ